MASELERILLRFDADTAMLRSALKDMDAGVDRSERNASARLAKIDNRFKNMGSSVGVTLAQLRTSLAAFASLNTLNNLLAGGGKLQALAETVGLTAEKYQGLAAAAREAGINQQQFDAAMTKFAVSVSEARQRTGGFYEFMRGQAPELLKQVQGSKNLSEAFDAVAEAVRSMGSAEDKALITKQAFGEGVVMLSRALEGGKAGLDAAAESARQLSAVASNESVKAVAELEKEVKKLGDTLYASAINGLGNFILWVKKLDKTLEDDQKKLGEFGDRLRGMFKGAAPTEGTTEFFDELEAAQKGGWARIEKAAIEGWTTVIEAPKKLRVDPKKLMPGADALAQLRIQAAEAGGRELEALDMQYAKEIETFRRLMEDKIITEKQYQEARGLISETMASKIAAVYDKETQMVRELADEFKSGLGGAVNSVFDSIIAGSFKASDAIRSLASDIAKLAMNRAVTQPLMNYLFGTTGAGGALTGALSSAFGGGGGGGWSTSVIPAMAHGGPMSVGNAYLAGERGPELIVPNTSAQVLSGWQTGGGGGGSVVYNIDARNADAGVEQRIMASIAKAERERPNPIASARNFSQRFPTRR